MGGTCGAVSHENRTVSASEVSGLPEPVVLAKKRLQDFAKRVC
jgi:hypothetical protein